MATGDARARPRIFISGSLAYDRIMYFPGRFSDHIMPDKLHILNITFTVNDMVERPGGTAANIAYALVLLGEKPVIIATIGHDCQRYFQRLDELGLTKEGVRVIQEEVTACAHITTDLADNQITAFNPGAMKHRTTYDLAAAAGPGSIVVIAAGNLQDMAHYAAVCRERGIAFIFDPGQSITSWEPGQLAEAIRGARLLISNDYELEMIMNRTGLGRQALLQCIGAIVTTKGEEGSVLVTRDGEVRIPAVKLPAPPVDPTGAGDAYRGGLVKGLVSGKDLVESAKIGTVCASFAVQHQGTQTYRFTTDEFWTRYRQTFG